MSWDDLIDQAPSFRTVEGEILSLAERAAHAVTRMPHPTDPGYATRMREAYESTLTTVADIASDPDDINAGMRVGYLWAQVIDFTPFVTVDGEELDLDLGPKHVLATWPAIVAGRYRQLRNVETGKGPLYKRQLANINAWLGTGGYEPNHAEVQAGWGHPYEEEQQAYPNPVDPVTFDLAAWKTLREARSHLAVKLTGRPEGFLDTDPQVIAEQLNAYEKALTELGWPINSQESRYLLWELLTTPHWEILQHTWETRTAEVTDMIATLKTAFGDTWAQRRDNLTAKYRQEPGEATRAFVERIERCFAQDLGDSWEEWTQKMRRHLIKRFIAGLRESTHHNLAITQDVDYLANLSWAEVTALTARVDQYWPYSDMTPAQTALGADSPPQQTVFALQQYSQDPWMTPDSQASSGSFSPSPDLHAHGNHFVPFSQDQTKPRNRRRRRRRRAKGNAPPHSEQRLDAFKSEVSLIKQLVNKMTTDMSEVSGRLRAPWGPPNAPYVPAKAPPPPQVVQVQPPYQPEEPSCNCCAPQVPPTQVPPTRYATNPTWETQFYPEDAPNPPTDAELYDSEYGRESADPSPFQENPSEEPEDETDDPFTRACYQALRHLIHPCQDPEETADWEPLPQGHEPPEEEPYWEEDPAQATWDEEETQLCSTPPADHNPRPELEEESDDVPHCAQFADPHTVMITRELPSSEDHPDDKEVPHCAQFADPRTVARAREPQEDEDGVPHCAQFADPRTVAEARRLQESRGEAPGGGGEQRLLTLAPATPNHPDPGSAPLMPPTDPIHFRDPAEDQGEPHSQDTQSPAEPDQPTHDVIVLDPDEAEIEQLVAELDAETPQLDAEPVETHAGEQ